MHPFGWHPKAVELMYEELGLDEDDGERFICSLEGSRTSAGQCAVKYAQNRGHLEHAVVGDEQPWEDAQIKRFGPAGAQ